MAIWSMYLSLGLAKRRDSADFCVLYSEEPKVSEGQGSITVSDGGMGPPGVSDSLA